MIELINRLRNFKLTIEYDGTSFHGWQRQKGHRTIQEEIERVIRMMVQESVALKGSGRTDAGVHALGQVANFRCNTRLTPAEIQRCMNALLPADIVIHDCHEAEPEFHAQYDAKSKLYRYHILNHPLRLAIGRQYSWHISKKLDLNAMQAALVPIRGTHDFKAFEGSGSPRISTVRHVIRAEFFETNPGHMQFEIEANGFLRFMVRNIVGTLVQVGFGKMDADNVAQILESGDRNRAAATAPPQGLFLVRVNYDGKFESPASTKNN